MAPVDVGPPTRVASGARAARREAQAVQLCAPIPDAPRPAPAPRSLPRRVARSIGRARIARPAGRNSRCLKLYCECFASGQYCFGCNCQGCHNNPENDDKRKRAIEATLERNPQAFRPKIGHARDSAAHNRGCHCRKSGCLKKYCECFQAGILCTDICKCINCKNRPTDQGGVGTPQHSVTAPSPAPKRQRCAERAPFRPGQSAASAATSQTPPSRALTSFDSMAGPSTPGVPLSSSSAQAIESHASRGSMSAGVGSAAGAPPSAATPSDANNRPLRLARAAIADIITDELMVEVIRLSQTLTLTRESRRSNSF